MTREQNVRAILESNFAGFKDEIIDVAVKNIMALSENKAGWIPVSERLPKVDQNVLATTKWGDITIAERLNIGPDCWFICEGEANAHTEDIVAWQPLPEPYKTEKGGE